MPSPSSILFLLQEGEMTLKGKFMWGSNYTFLAEVEHQGETQAAVYKPSRGEQPLWDFPTASLAHREVAAYLLSEALGWHFVPETVYRRQAPLGPGSLQRFIEHDPDEHYFNISAEDRQRLRPVVLFDLIINNADRKGGHVLFDDHRNLWLIDHGICFHAEDKLRTVIWDFAGEPVPQEYLDMLEALLAQLREPSELITALAEHISQREIRALRSRIRRLVKAGVFPGPDPERRPYPWPPL